MRSRIPVAVLVLLILLGGPMASGAAATEQDSVPGGQLLAGAGLVLDAPGATSLPDVGAASWVLADLGTGEVLAAKAPHSPQRPASTLKILTALAVLPVLDPAAAYTARFEDADVEGSKVGLVPDATYTVHNLLEALFLVSGNDAASALANAAGGTAPTVELMNRTARDLGALDTRAVNPSGLDAPGQLTSAYDLAVLTRAAMARADFRAYASTVKSQFPGKMPRPGKVRRTYEIYTQDRLLLNYRGAIGVKTGWTTKARGTFVGAATRGGRTLVVTVMNTDYYAWRESAALLTWGFRNASLARPVGTLDAVAGLGAGSITGDRDRSRAAAAPSTAEGRSAGAPRWAVRALVVLGTVLAVLGTAVVLLRTRVLLRRRRRRWGNRRVRLEPMARMSSPGGPARVPQPRDLRPDPTRDRRRATTPASAPPSHAPMATSRNRQGGRATADASDAPPAASGTGW